MSDFFLADDLSGALDAAAGFHHAGQHVTIVLQRAAWRTVGENEVVGFTTESRNAAPSVAATAVANAIAHGRTLGGRLVYKKIDSTLRGAVAAEMAALARALPDVRILFAPANPRAGRIVRDGQLLVHGIAVAETEFGQDPVSPVRESRLRSVLGEIAPGRIVIPDIVHESDLETAVRRMAKEVGPWVGVGSGALARPVAAELMAGRRGRFTGPQNIAARPVVTGRAGPQSCLLICGSAHRRNRAQAAALETARGVRAHELRLAADAETVASATGDLRSVGGAAILIEEKRGDSHEVIRAVANAAVQVIRTAGVRRIFATGGETAFAVCHELGISSLQFERELESGLSLSRGHTPDGAEYRLAIKPGGFGEDETWIRAWDALNA